MWLLPKTVIIERSLLGFARVNNEPNRSVFWFGKNLYEFGEIRTGAQILP